MTKVAVGAFSGGNDASQWLLFVGATTTTPLAQVKTFNWVQDVVTDEQMRVECVRDRVHRQGHQRCQARLSFGTVQPRPNSRQLAVKCWRLTTLQRR